MVTVAYAPILVWPGSLQANGYRDPSPFTAEWSITLEQLDREVRHLGAQRCTIMLAHPAHAFRADGGMHGKYRDRAPEHPGVILSVPTTRHGELTYATDKFSRWRDNLRAIVLGLESLRRVERYGIGDAGQQYVGYRALTGGTPMGVRAAALTLDEAATILAHGFGDGTTYKPADVLADMGVARRCYVQAAQILHPDKPTGDTAKFQRLDEAWRLVLSHHRQVGT